MKPASLYEYGHGARQTPAAAKNRDRRSGLPGELGPCGWLPENTGMKDALREESGPK
jgi:hypothetical protein